MTFDDNRSAAALELLAEIGAEQQVVVLTHHDAVRDAALAVEGVAVVCLNTRADVDPIVVIDDHESSVKLDELDHDVLVGDPMDLLELVEHDVAATARSSTKRRGRGPAA